MKQRSRPWQRMRRAERVDKTPEQRDAIRQALLDKDPSRPPLTDDEIDNLASKEMWKNDRYTVGVERRPDGSVESLSIRRNDRKAAHDWRHFQMIKNEIAGPEVEAVELYPAMSRLMDTSNQYWLFCVEPGVQLTVGMERGAVTDADDPIHAQIGSVQRELPPEWKPGQYPGV